MSYQWSTGDTTLNLSGLCAGTYIVTVMDSLGCVAADTLVATDPSPLSATVTENYSNCQCLYTINVSGGTPVYAYQWCNGATGNQMVSCDTGDCVVQITDANGCLLIDTLILNPPPPLSVTMQSTGTSCSGCTDGSATAFPSGGVGLYTYIWNPTQMTTQSINFLPAGIFWVCVTDSNNCTVCDSITVADDPTMLSSLDQRNTIKFYPNPFNHRTVLEISDSFFSHDSRLEIMNLQGEVLHVLTLTQKTTFIDRRNFANGIYFVKITGARGSVMDMLVIQ